MPKLSIFIFCSHRVQLQVLQTQGTGKRQPAGNTHNTPLALRSPRAHTSATRAAPHRTVSPKKTIRKQAEALYRIDTRFLLSHSCRKVSVKTVRSLQPAESKSSRNTERCWFPCSEEPAEPVAAPGPAESPGPGGTARPPRRPANPPLCRAQCASPAKPGPALFQPVPGEAGSPINHTRSFHRCNRSSTVTCAEQS